MLVESVLVKNFPFYFFLERILWRLLVRFSLLFWGGNQLKNFSIIPKIRWLKKKNKFNDFSINSRKVSLNLVFFVLRSGFFFNLIVFEKLRLKKKNHLFWKTKRAQKKKTFFTKITLKKFRTLTILSSICNPLSKKILFYQKNFSSFSGVYKKKGLFINFLITKNRFYLTNNNFNFFKTVILISRQSEILSLPVSSLLKSKNKPTSFLIKNSLGVIYPKKRMFLNSSLFLKSTWDFFFLLNWSQIKKRSFFSTRFFNKGGASLILNENFRIFSKFNVKFRNEGVVTSFSFYFEIFNQFFYFIFKESAAFICKKKKHSALPEKKILFFLKL